MRGGLDVANDIEMKLSGSPLRTDTNIARAVRDALGGGAFLPDRCIHSTMGQGIVSLEGAVDLSSDREDSNTPSGSLPGCAV